MKTNTGSEDELGKQLFLQIAKPEKNKPTLSIASIYQKYKRILQPIKISMYAIISVVFSFIGPVFNRLLVLFDSGEGIEVYAIKK